MSSPSYGNCFTFNSNFSDSTYGGARMSSLPGAHLGLELVLMLEQAQYMKKGMTKSAGGR
jgi:hypothetical protein